MKRNSILKIVNPILGILLVSQITTGLLGGTLSREVFEIVHKKGGILLAIVVSLHVTLNWPWIKTTFFTKSASHQA